MANVIIYNVNTKRVLEYIKSVNTPEYSSRADVVVNPDLPNGDIKYWLVKDGIVVEATQVEKDLIDQHEVDVIAQTEIDRLKEIDDSMADVDLSGVKIQRVETAIENISNLSEAKTFLKRLVRYIIIMQNQF